MPSECVWFQMFRWACCYRAGSIRRLSLHWQCAPRPNRSKRFRSHLLNHHSTSPTTRGQSRSFWAQIITKSASARIWRQILSAISDPGWMNRSAIRHWCPLYLLVAFYPEARHGGAGRRWRRRIVCRLSDVSRSSVGQFYTRVPVIARGIIEPLVRLLPVKTKNLSFDYKATQVHNRRKIRSGCASSCLVWFVYAGRAARVVDCAKF